ncbi:hypothetical protein L6164_034795 [Bauhinia variegata]|uniref:Uncharacterized protein n=1 Tax=Bauhinia variegata TaxID=167791 RepID=A0ACB9KVU3_BAUVA|nr:hypothetical protein L6164_034795 [Bauhinia variegata]
MASTPPQCSINGSRPYQNNHYPQNHHHHLKNHRHERRQNHQYWPSNKVSFFKSSPSPRNAANPSAAPCPLPQNPTVSPLCALSTPKSEFGADFSSRRSTRLVSKMHLGRPKVGYSSSHTSIAEEALQVALQRGNDVRTTENLLIEFEPKLKGCNDYAYLIRELGNRGECSKAIKCFEFAVSRDQRKYDQGRLTSSTISTLGRLGEVELAKRVFEMARNEGYGNTVYAYSALISAYGRNGYYDEAIRIFESMKHTGLKPNLVTYNAVIDASGKGGVELKKVLEIFDEMLSNGVQPDRITYNSLLAVCSRGGLWEIARNLFSEMVERGIDQDIFTYNTLLDALCKGGQMDLAMAVISEMRSKTIFPNVVTYSTMVDGYAKAGRLEEALNVFNDMKFLSIGPDRVSYNSLLSIYAKLGRFEDALNTCKEMESCGIKKDAVTYNALLDGYGKQGKYDEVRRAFEEMKAENVCPNLLTYSTLIDVYSKGGMYWEAMEVFREFKQAGLKADVVLYSALIDTLCKNGLVKSAAMLLDEMTKEGIRPNVVTYNSIIDAFGGSLIGECGFNSSIKPGEHQLESSSSMLIKGTVQNEVENEDNQIIKMFGQLAAEKTGHAKKDKRGRQDISCILGVFQKMHLLEIKPNVVTFSAILNACSRCNSYEEASMLLEELRLFDNQVYGVAHGLLMGYRENIWVQARSLFDEVKHMDSSTASGFYNALTDMLWHFGQKRGAQLVALEGQRRNVWECVWTQSCLDLHLMSCGAACAMVHAWLLNIRSVVFEGRELPKLLSILTGWGKHSKVVGEGILRRAVEAFLNGMGAPFRIAECNLGRFTSTGSLVAAWLKGPGTLNVFVLHDDKSNPDNAKLGQISTLRTACV